MSENSKYIHKSHNVTASEAARMGAKKTVSAYRNSKEKIGAYSF